MRKTAKKATQELKLFWKNYVFQSFFASIAVFIVLLILSLKHAVIIASIGATAFVVFAIPKGITAKPRNVIGGYIVGLLCGSLFSLIPHNSALFSAVIYSLAVGASIFIMVVTDTEHPPASGIALGVVIQGFSWDAAATSLVSAVVLSLIHHFFKKYLRDLV